MDDQKAAKRRFRSPLFSRKTTFWMSVILITLFLILYFYFPEVWQKISDTGYQEAPFVNTP